MIGASDISVVRLGRGLTAAAAEGSFVCTVATLMVVCSVLA